jgi:hypothetical protein
MEQLLQEGGRVFIAQGLLGVMLLAFGWVIFRIYTDLRKSELQCSEMMREQARVLAELSHGIEERNRVLQRISEGMLELSTGFKALGQLLDAQHDRLLDRVADVRHNQRPPG